MLGTERVCQPEDKEKLQADVVLCCSKWLMTLAVVVLWLSLQWFIATAHNVIRLYIYPQQNSVVLRYDPNMRECLCMCELAHTHLHYYCDGVHLNASRVSVNRKKTDSSVYNLCIKAGNVLHVRHITLFNMWWMCLPLTEIAWGLFTLLLPRSSINRSYLLWKYTHAVFDGSGLWLLVCLGLFSLLKKMEDSRYHEASKSKMSLFQVKNNHR